MGVKGGSDLLRCVDVRRNQFLENANEEVYQPYDDLHHEEMFCTCLTSCKASMMAVAMDKDDLLYLAGEPKGWGLIQLLGMCGFQIPLVVAYTSVLFIRGSFLLDLTWSLLLY